MGSADFKLIRIAGVTADSSFSRPSPKWVFDRTGTLVQVSANTLGVTYDPTDLSKAPSPSLEPAATNLWTWAADLTQASWSPAYVSIQSVARANAFGANVNRVTPDSSTGLHFVGRNVVPALTAGLSYSATFVVASGSLRATVEFFDGSAYRYVTADLVAGAIVSADGALKAQLSGPDSFGFYILTVTGTVASASGTSRFTLFAADASGLNFTGNGALFLDVAFAQLEQGLPSSFMPTAGTTTTRAADAIGPGAGLVYSNVPIAERTYSAGATFAQNELAYDPTSRLTYLSLIPNNINKLLTDKTAWVKQLTTNRWRMCDKAVNSQTSAPEILVVAVKFGTLVNTLGLLNVNGSRVTVYQTESGYTRTKSLVRHQVLNWYDWFYEEPIREGDVVFTDVPPYVNSTLVIVVENPGNNAALGCCIGGKARTVGQTNWDFTGGALSYSSSETDPFGNLTMVRRDSAKILNFEVSIARGFESEAYRLLKDATDVEIMIIGVEAYSMTYSYGYLGQWSVPVTNKNKTAHVEFRGLV